MKKLNPIKKLSIKFLASWAVTSLERRELCRFDRGLVFGFARRLFLAIGENLKKSKRIISSRDIFYLTLDEILSLEKKSNKNFQKLVAQRKQQETKWRNIDMPRRIETDSYPVAVQKAKFKKSFFKELNGVLASAGSSGDFTEEKALVLKEFSLTANYSGKILVTKQTDPGWTIVFPLLKGIIVERGGLLSHAAVVAREYGIPCFVGVENATDIIKTGDLIKLDVKNKIITVG
jgi:pyruvate,water dikinase